MTINWERVAGRADNLHAAQVAGYTLHAWDTGEWKLIRGARMLTGSRHQVKTESLRGAQLRAQAALLATLTPGEIKSNP